MLAVHGLFGETAQSERKLQRSKLEQENIKDASLFPRKRLFALFVPWLMTGALYRTVLPNNPCIHGFRSIMANSKCNMINIFVNKMLRQKY